MKGHFASSLYGLKGHFSLSFVSKAISRYFATLDPILQSNFDLIKPKTFTGDFEVEIGFVISDKSSGMIILSGGTGENGFEIYKNSSGTFSIFREGVSLGGTFLNYADGVFRKLRVKRTGTTASVFIDKNHINTITLSGPCTIRKFGHRYESAFYTKGYLISPKLTDLSGAEPVTETYTLGNAPVDTFYKYGDELWGNAPTSMSAGWVDNGDGSYTCDGSQNALVTDNNNLIDPSKTYEISYEIENYVSGEVRSLVYSPLLVETGKYTKGNGQYSEVMSPIRTTGSTSATGRIVFQSIASFVGTIRNISAKEITNYNDLPNQNIEYCTENSFGPDLKDTSGQGTLGDGWSMLEAHKYRCDGTNATTSYIPITGALEVGKTFEIKCRISNYLKGNFRINTVTSNSPQAVNDGLITWTYTPTSSTNFNLQGLGDFNQFDIELVSIKEILANGVVYSGIPDVNKRNYSERSGHWFSENLIVNGNFDTDSKWDKVEPSGTTVEINEGRAHVMTDGQGSGLTQVISDIGVALEVTVDYEAVSGGLKVQVGTEAFPAMTESRTYIFSVTAEQNTNGKIYLYHSSGPGEGYFDNIKVRQKIEIAS